MQLGRTRHSHVAQMIAQADAWHAGRYEEAYAAGAEAYLHMGVIAGALATGIAVQQPGAFPGSADAREVALCADANLSIGWSVTTRADLAWAQLLGPAANVDAAHDASETALADALSWLSTTDVSRLNELLDSIDGTTGDPVVAVRGAGRRRPDHTVFVPALSGALPVR